jgi:hypothetical protein
MIELRFDNERGGVWKDTSGHHVDCGNYKDWDVQWPN